MGNADLADVNESVEISGVPKNFLMNSREFQPVIKGRRIFFSKNELQKWKKLRSERTYVLDIDGYAKCFDFSLAML